VADVKPLICEACNVPDIEMLTTLNGDEILHDCAGLAVVGAPDATFTSAAVDDEVTKHTTLRIKQDAMDHDEETRFMTAKTNIIDRVDDEEYGLIEASKGDGIDPGRRSRNLPAGMEKPPEGPHYRRAHGPQMGEWLSPVAGGSIS
jgi:hypothetical protein